ncbi:unnamed protein product [Diplocarpon coronariae]
MLIQGTNIVLIIRKFGHLWLLLYIKEEAFAQFLAKPELRRLHRRFGYISIAKLAKVLNRASQEYDLLILQKIEDVSKVERYYAAVRKAYKIISTELSNLFNTLKLQMAFKAINNSVGPNGLILTLLVFRTYPYLINLRERVITTLGELFKALRLKEVKGLIA